MAVPSSFESVNEYLAALPRGLDSYSDHLQKASVYRRFTESVDLTSLAGDLPEPVASLIRHPEPASAWVPEVHVSCLYLAAYDALFQDEARMLDQWLSVYRALYASPLYRVLMFVANPAKVVAGAEPRWTTLHRGIEVSATLVSPTSARSTLRYPKNLVPRRVAIALRTSFMAALEAAGGRNVRYVSSDHGPLESTAQVSWD